NNGVSELDLQSFSRHRSRESLAEYCKISNDQHITNTAMLIPFSFEDLDLDEYDYGNRYKGLVEEANEDNESDLENSSTTRPTNIEIQKTQPRNFEILETQLQSIEIQPERVEIQETQSTNLEIQEISNPYSTSSIIALFKPPYHSDSPMII
ncbi:3520_t:CDS:2, partial [Dentiscutata heterogama]